MAVNVSQRSKRRTQESVIDNLLIKLNHLSKEKALKQKSFRAFYWCRWPDSNRHAVASGGF